MSQEQAIDARYAEHYRQRDPDSVYPVEFVVRAFLGSYPRLQLDRSDYPGKRILDVGFGDGRNLPLLADLGFAVSGVEISEQICEPTRRRMARLGVGADLRVGHNAALPFDDGTFQYLLACHSCYYVAAGDTFDDNLAEIARVLAKGGTFVFSAPMRDTYILQGAEELGGGHFRITADPYGLRNGTVFRGFASAAEIEEALRDRFTDLRIGTCMNDYWGIEERLFIVVCRRRS